MATNTLDVLQQALADAQSNLKKEQDAYTALTQDPTYIYDRLRLDDGRVAANSRGWLDSQMVFWIGDDAQSSHQIARAYVENWKAKINTQHNVVVAAQASLDSATVALENYEKTSPLAAGQLALQQTNANTANQAAQNKRTVVIVVAVLFGLLLVTFVIYRIAKSKKNKKDETKTVGVPST